MKPAPHFLASTQTAVASALRLARLQAADRVLDLGCGDGTILAAAAQTAETVIGLEIDPGLARQARDRLASFKGRIVEANIFECDLTAFAPTVVFAFLTRAALQRMSERIQALPAGTRVITLEMPIPGWECTAREGNCHLYELPAPRRTPRGTTGWPVPGFRLVLPAQQYSSFSLVINHPAGTPRLTLASNLTDIGTLATGAEQLAEPGDLAIDLQWRPMPDGTLRLGALTGTAIGDLLLLVMFEKDCRTARAVSLRGEVCRRLAVYGDA